MSSAVDDDVKQTVAKGRENLGAMLSTAQTHLQKAFITFVIGLVATIWVLRAFIWERLKADLNANPDIVVIAITPFEVILLQVKIGLVVGVLLSIPVVIYYSRDALRRRGRWPQNLPRWKAAGFAGVSTLLFLGGVAYAYNLFFPLMFDFLASNAVGAGLQPTYSISMWAQFIFLLSLSFGLAAQLPLLMSTLAYSEIVAYETFRDKWKYAIIGIFAFGALFSPPDPFTQIMWAVPLVTLYGVSLYLTKIVVTAKRSKASLSPAATARAHPGVLAGLFVVGAAGSYLFYTYGGVGAVNTALAAVDSSYRFLPPGEGYGVTPAVHVAVFGVLYGLVFAGCGLAYFIYRRLQAAEQHRYAVPGGTVGDPADIDLSQLDAAGIRAAPRAAFEDLTEDEAMGMASEALQEDDRERAEAIVERFDGVHEEGSTADGTDESAETTGESEGETQAAEDDDAGLLTRRGAGILDAFSEDDIDEDDVGGYAYDIAFVAESLTSKSFRLVGLGMGVMALTFYLLYSGGIRALNEQFVSRMPSQFAAEQVSVVTLHPVEALIFMIKVSVIFGVAAVFPLLLYYAWPALKERGIARGDRRFLLVWGGSLLVGMGVGSVVGFIYVAPGIISWLAADVLRAEMIIAYRINNYGWLIFFTTVGLGILALIPVSMFLFHRGGILGYPAMQARWREFAIAVLALGAFLSPRGVFTMFLLGLPVIGAYGLGLGLLWVYTLGGRRRQPGIEPAD
ncbi:MAG: twin-arginine translocase subunit TatC [Natronomonas sp.]